MFKLVFLLLIAINSYAAVAESNTISAVCTQQAVYGLPQATTQGILVCRQAYTSLNDTRAKIPVWTSYTLTRSHALGCLARNDQFRPDTSLPLNQRAELSDYSNSGYDKGHLAPDGDMIWDPRISSESFLLSNIVPQVPGLNRSSWRSLETAVRSWAIQRNHTLLIYTGPIYGINDKTIGRNQVVVPHSFYKIVVDTETLEYQGFIMHNINNQGTNLLKFRVPVSLISNLTRVHFPLPSNSIETPINRVWSVGLASSIKIKKQTCGL